MKEEIFVEEYGIDSVEFTSIGGVNVENITAGSWLAGVINMSNYNQYDQIQLYYHLQHILLV